MSWRYDDFDDFQRDLDRSGELSDDPFGIDIDIGQLDQEDLDLLITPAKRKAPPKKKTT